MGATILTMCMLTLGLDGGGLLAQDPSLRRVVLPSAELSVALRPLPYTQISAGYGLARQSESFPGLESRTTYHRFPLRLGGRMGWERAAMAASLGVAPINTRTRFEDEDERVSESRWGLGLVLGVRGELNLVELEPFGALAGRLVMDVYLRGRRTDVSMLLGASWRFGSR